MAYAVFHADWKDTPDASTPVTAAALEWIEAGIVAAAAVADAAVPKTLVDQKGDLIIATTDNAVGREPVGANDTVLTAASAQTRGVIWQKVGNAMIAAAAGINISKLEGYPSDTTKYLRGDGTWPTLPVIPTVGYGTSLPGSPVDGQEFILVDSVASATYMWRMRYNASSSSAYKWEFVGGTPKQSYLGAETTTTTGSWTDLGTTGPTFTIPNTGEYLIHYMCNIQHTTGCLQIGPGIAVGAGTPFSDCFENSGSNNFGMCYDSVIAVWTATQVARMRYFKSDAGTGTFYDRRMLIYPNRIA